MSSSATQTTASNTIGIRGFFTDPGFDFVTRSMIGYAAQGVMDIGQVFATIARVKDGNADSWYAAWRETAEKLHGQAKISLAAGHTATAHRRFLAASEGYAQAGVPRRSPTKRHSRRPSPYRANAGRPSSIPRPAESNASPCHTSMTRYRASCSARTLPARKGQQSS
jgi:hypothetical protein